MSNSIKHNFNPMALREKHSAESRTNSYSSFWLDNGWDNNTSIFDDEETKKGVDLVALASYRRAISNFVSIVTGESDIKVTFNTSGDSYTNGKEVTISSKLDDKLFDSTVGLALHEGSHIKLSDFDFLKQLDTNIPAEYFNRGEAIGMERYEVIGKLKNLLNYVEDRRIDYFVFSNSPGYKGYYHKMYEKYFHAKVIDKALGSNEYTSVDWDSYEFRIINLTNKNTLLDVLPGLKDIRKAIFSNVKNLDSTAEAFAVALNVFDIILSNLEAQPKVDGGKGDGEEGADGSESGGDENDMGSKGDGNSDGEGESMSGKSSENQPENSNSDLSELSDRQKKQLSNAVKKQKKFMDGDITKKKLTKKDKASMDAVESAGMKYVDVANGVTDNYYGKKTPTKVLLVKKFTKALAESDTIRMIQTPNYRWAGEETKEAITKGLVMGTMLGRKLQVRGESRETKWSRKDSGRIDKRLIAELGFGNQRVFHTSFVEQYSDAFLHISVDASGSMGGKKWINTQTCVAAIAKACSMISNVDCVISYRSTQDTGNYRRGGKNFPLMMIAYDSRVDKINKIKNLFPLLRPSGTTPEGLCFEAIMKEIEPASKDKDSYFLNLSDGMPMFSNDDIDYNYDTAINHTKSMVNEIRNRGVKVLSYFIGDSYDRDRSTSTFKKMYGSDAEFINVTSVLPVAKTMNKKFLQK
tara:strand:- start:48 stop:2129 length:2082 start_codon:yes stop_codon:yes gene_type:complete